MINTLQKRYPYIVNNDTIPYIRTWLSAKSELDRVRILNSYSTDIDKCESILTEFIQQQKHHQPLKYPLTLGNETNINEAYYLSKDLKLTMAMYLATRYMLNFEASHCIHLPKEFCQIPWSEKGLISKF